MTEHAPMPAPAQAQHEVEPHVQHRNRIPLASPIIDAEMKEAALGALENEKLVMGESVHKFEEEFARFCGTKYAVSTASGTAALSITLQALGISHGRVSRDFPRDRSQTRRGCMSSARGRVWK